MRLKNDRVTVRLLLDTHVFIWLAIEPEKVSKTVRERVKAADRVFVSAASVWEMEIKRKTGKLGYDFNPAEAVDRMGFEALPVTIDHAMATGRVQLDNADPFDRMLMAQALSEHLMLVTVDRKIVETGAKFVMPA